MLKRKKGIDEAYARLDSLQGTKAASPEEAKQLQKQLAQAELALLRTLDTQIQGKRSELR